jgi:hypothetical protein
MKTATQNSYTHLKECLETWKNTSSEDRDNTAAHAHFQLVAQEMLIPELRTLAQILEERGLECEVFAGDENTVEVGIRVETFHAVLRLLPADRPTCIRAIIAGGQRPNNDLEWFIPYHQIANGGLERELQSVMIRLLTSYRVAA